MAASAVARAHPRVSRATRVTKPAAVMRLAGWTSLRQLPRYDHPDEPDLLRGVEGIGARPTHVLAATAQKAPETGPVSALGWRGRRDSNPRPPA